ncbi:MAG: nickel pincer cofactor biosynthesis protein LarC [Nitrospirae bacterium]|nr:nickel pincer cofactor biosynthesis protein LarC [Nitrospirota bacterium]
MKDTVIAYIECISGVSGDMLVGALLDAGVPLEFLRERLSTLLLRGPSGKVEAFEITAGTVRKNAFRALKFDVETASAAHGHRTWPDIKEIINTAGFDEDIKEKGLNIFHSIFEAESLVHGLPLSHTHLHELGAIDCLADVFGFLIGVKYLGIEKIFVSPINVGGGTVNAAHGALPVPAPATAYLLKGLHVYSGGEEFELTTPTGAAIIKGTAAGVGAFPNMVINTIGTGAGNRDLTTRPNILRIFIGTSTAPSRANADTGEIVAIETNIDDMSPQLYGSVMDKLFQCGALDVYITPVIMKKCRPAALLTVIAEVDRIEPLSQVIFAETTTIGLRHYGVSRETLHREISTVKTKYGEIRIKTALRHGKVLNVSAEYEDCKKAADKFSVPVKKAIDEALRQANDS